MPLFIRVHFTSSLSLYISLVYSFLYVIVLRKQKRRKSVDVVGKSVTCPNPSLSILKMMKEEEERRSLLLLTTSSKKSSFSDSFKSFWERKSSIRSLEYDASLSSSSFRSGALFDDDEEEDAGWLFVSESFSRIFVVLFTVLYG